MENGRSEHKGWKNYEKNTPLFGCSWAGAALISVRSSFSKLYKGE